ITIDFTVVGVYLYSFFREPTFSINHTSRTHSPEPASIPYVTNCNHFITSPELDKCKLLVKYCNRHVRDVIELLDAFKTPDFTALKNEVFKIYDKEAFERKFTLKDLKKLVAKSKTKPLKSLGHVRKYHRCFIRIASWLKTKNKIEENPMNLYYWKGIHKKLRNRVEGKVLRANPTHDIKTPFKINHMLAALESIFSRDRFDADETDLEDSDDPDDDSDDDSENSDSDSDDSESDVDTSDSEEEFDRSRSKKSKSRSKKEKPSKKRQRKPVSSKKAQSTHRKLESEESTAQERDEVEVLIKKLQGMDISDPNFVPLYFRALKLDKDVAMQNETIVSAVQRLTGKSNYFHFPFPINTDPSDSESDSSQLVLAADRPTRKTKQTRQTLDGVYLPERAARRNPSFDPTNDAHIVSDEAGPRPKKKDKVRFSEEQTPMNTDLPKPSKSRSYNPMSSEVRGVVTPRDVAHKILNTPVPNVLVGDLLTAKDFVDSLQSITRFKRNPNSNNNDNDNTAAPTNNMNNIPAQSFRLNSGTPLIYITVTLRQQGRNIPVKAIVDTGSTMNLVHEDFYREHLRHLPMNPNAEIPMQDANSGLAVMQGLVPNVELWCGSILTRGSLVITPRAPFQLLLGREWQKRNQISIDERDDGGTYLIFKSLTPNMEMLTTSQPSSSSFYADVVVRRAESTIPFQISRLSDETTQPIPTYTPNTNDTPQLPLDQSYRLRLSTTPAYPSSYGLYEECFYEDWYLPNISLFGSSPHDPRLARPGQAYIRFFPFQSDYLPYPVIHTIPLNSPFYDQPLYVPQDYALPVPTLPCISSPAIPECLNKEKYHDDAYGQNHDFNIPFVPDNPFLLNPVRLNNDSSLLIHEHDSPVRTMEYHDTMRPKDEPVDTIISQEEAYQEYIRELAIGVTESFETGGDDDESETSIPSLVSLTPSPSLETRQPSRDTDVYSPATYIDDQSIQTPTNLSRDASLRSLCSKHRDATPTPFSLLPLDTQVDKLLQSIFPSLSSLPFSDNDQTTQTHTSRSLDFEDFPVAPDDVADNESEFDLYVDWSGGRDRERKDIVGEEVEGLKDKEKDEENETLDDICSVYAHMRADPDPLSNTLPSPYIPATNIRASSLVETNVSLADEDLTVERMQVSYDLSGTMDVNEFASHQFISSSLDENSSRPEAASLSDVKDGTHSLSVDTVPSNETTTSQDYQPLSLPPPQTEVHSYDVDAAQTTELRYHTYDDWSEGLFERIARSIDSNRHDEGRPGPLTFNTRIGILRPLSPAFLDELHDREIVDPEFKNDWWKKAEYLLSDVRGEIPPHFLIPNGYLPPGKRVRDDPDMENIDDPFHFAYRPEDYRRIFENDHRSETSSTNNDDNDDEDVSTSNLKVDVDGDYTGDAHLRELYAMYHSTFIPFGTVSAPGAHIFDTTSLSPTSTENDSTYDDDSSFINPYSRLPSSPLSTPPDSPLPTPPSSPHPTNLPLDDFIIKVDADTNADIYERRIDAPPPPPNSPIYATEEVFGISPQDSLLVPPTPPLSTDSTPSPSTYSDRSEIEYWPADYVPVPLRYARGLLDKREQARHHAAVVNTFTNAIKTLVEDAAPDLISWIRDEFDEPERHEGILPIRVEGTHRRVNERRHAWPWGSIASHADRPARYRFENGRFILPTPSVSSTTSSSSSSPTPMLR
ncbi:hypothetical protein EUX98_g8803, partial [Antrodiella citrinella]